jgi:hypothetical protein
MPVPLLPPVTPNRDEHPFVGMVLWRGLALDIETAEGETRRGSGWEVVMPAHYGEVRGTVSALDGDPVDVFVGPALDAPMAFVVHQKHPGTAAIDEDKVMIGFASAEEAETAYRRAYTAGGFFHGMTRWPADELAGLLRAGGTVPRLDRPQAVRDRLALAVNEQRQVIVTTDKGPRPAKVIASGAMGLTVQVDGETLKVAHGAYTFLGDELGQEDDTSTQEPATWDEDLDFSDTDWKPPTNWRELTDSERIDFAAWRDIESEIGARYPANFSSSTDAGSALAQAQAYLRQAVTDGWMDRANVGHAIATVREVARLLAAPRGELPRRDREVMRRVLADTAAKVLHLEVEACRRAEPDRGARHIHVGLMHLLNILDALDVEPAFKTAAALAWVNHDLGYTLPMVRAGAIDDALHPALSARLFAQWAAGSWAMRDALLPLDPSLVASWIAGHASTQIDANDRVGSAFRIEGATHLWATKALEDLVARPAGAQAVARMWGARGPLAGPLRGRMVAPIDRAASELGHTPQALGVQAWAAAQIDGYIEPQPGGLQGHLIGLDFNPGTSTLTLRVGPCQTREALDRVFGADEPTKQARRVFGAAARVGEDMAVPGPLTLAVVWTGDTYDRSPVQLEFERALERAGEQWSGIEAIQDEAVRDMAAFGYADMGG